MESTSLTASALFALALSLAIYQLGKPTPLPNIPHNKLHWFTGDLPLLARFSRETGSVSLAFDDTARRLGPVSQIVIGLGASWLGRLLGLGECIVILADSQEIQDVLVNRGLDFDRQPLYEWMATIPQGMLCLTGPQVKHHKRWLGITMTSPYLARMTPRIVDGMQELVDLWVVGAQRLNQGPSSDTALINVIDDMKLATSDVIGSITFGASFNGVQLAVDSLEANPAASPSTRPEIPRLVADLEVLLDTIAAGAMAPAPRFLPWLTRTFNGKWRKAIDNTHDFLKGRLYAARAEYALGVDVAGKPAAHEADNVLEMILEREREDKSKGTTPLDDNEIIDELVTFALGGTETTATAMQWAAKILCKQPDVQRKLRSELLTKLPAMATRSPTYTEICDENNLPYLNAVVYEILRYSRIASMAPRHSTRDTVFGIPCPERYPHRLPGGNGAEIGERRFEGRHGRAGIGAEPVQQARKDGILVGV